MYFRYHYFIRYIFEKASLLKNDIGIKQICDFEIMNAGWLWISYND